MPIILDIPLQDQDKRRKWEMTSDEVAQWNVDQFKSCDFAQNILDELYIKVKKSHKDDVEYAISVGEYIPRNVLQEYPELMEVTPCTTQ